MFSDAMIRSVEKKNPLVMQLNFESTMYTDFISTHKSTRYSCVVGFKSLLSPNLIESLVFL